MQNIVCLDCGICADSLNENQCIPSKTLKEYPVTITRSSLLTAFLSNLAAPTQETASISNPRQSSLPSPTFNPLAIPSVAPGASGSLSLPLQSLLNSFDASLNAIGVLRHKDRRGGKQGGGDSHLEAIKHLSAADGSASALLSATGVSLSRLAFLAASQTERQLIRVVTDSKRYEVWQKLKIDALEGQCMLFVCFWSVVTRALQLEGVVLDLLYAMLRLTKKTSSSFFILDFLTPSMFVVTLRRPWRPDEASPNNRHTVYTDLEQSIEDEAKGRMI